MQRSTTAHTSCPIIGRGDILPYIHAEVTRLVHILDMIVSLISSRNEIISQVQRWISHDQHLSALVQRRGIAGHNASLFQFFRCCQVQVGGVYTVMIKRIHQLDLVDVQVSAHNGKDESATCYITDGLDRLRLRNLKEGRQVTDRSTVGRVDLCMTRVPGGKKL